MNNYRIILCAIFLSNYAFCLDNEFLNKQKEGYYFYQQEPKDQNTSKQSKSKMPAIPKDLTTLTPKEFEKLLEEVKGIAVMNPTDENLKTYIKLQNFAMNQSLQFQKKWKDVVLDNPELNIGINNPDSSYSKGIVLEEKENARKTFYITNNDRLGLVVFLKNENDQRSKKTLYILSSIKEDYGLSYNAVYVDQNPALVEEKGIKAIPDFWLIYRDANNNPIWNRIGSGLITKNEIMDNIDHIVKRKLKIGADK